MTKVDIAGLSKTLGNSKNDTGSVAVQIGILSKRIEDLTKHNQEHAKDLHSNRGLLQMVGKRKRLLSYLKSSDPKTYDKVVKELKIR